MRGGENVIRDGCSTIVQVDEITVWYEVVKLIGWLTSQPGPNVAAL